jgi:hypothetical protein
MSRGIGGPFQPFGEARQGVLRLIRTNRFPRASDSPYLFTTEGKPPRGSRGPDGGDRRCWGVERNDPGRIWLALNRPGTGQVTRAKPWYRSPHSR